MWNRLHSFKTLIFFIQPFPLPPWCLSKNLAQRNSYFIIGLFFLINWDDILVIIWIKQALEWGEYCLKKLDPNLPSFWRFGKSDSFYLKFLQKIWLSKMYCYYRSKYRWHFMWNVYFLIQMCFLSHSHWLHIFSLLRWSLHNLYFSLWFGSLQEFDM